MLTSVNSCDSLQTTERTNYYADQIGGITSELWLTDCLFLKWFLGKQKSELTVYESIDGVSDF
jgi:hypothetical protein